MQERNAPSLPGLPVLLAILAILVYLGFSFVDAVKAQAPVSVAVHVLVFVVLVALLCGLFVVQPNRGTVLQLFGKYTGTVRAHGLRFTNPFYSKRPVSLRVRNFESSKLKVNDIEGNPIEIAAIVVWQVVDTAQAVFDVDDYENFAHVQTESALRQMATSYPYDLHEEGK